MAESTPEEALSVAGIPCTKIVDLDGKLHRYKTPGDSEANCWYVFYEHDAIISGVFGCWKRQFTQKWSSLEYAKMSSDQKNQTRAQWQAAAERQKQEQEELQKKTRMACEAALKTWPAAKSHPYLTRKGVDPVGDVRVASLEHVSGWLAIPLNDEHGVVHSCQFIAEDGTKRFYYGGRVQGCFFPIPGRDSGPILICEGYATGCSLSQATGWTVVCAMNCGNLLAVCQTFRKLYPERTLVICADNDQFTDGNPGVEKARVAAKASKSVVSTPEFGDESLADKPTDFNDLHRIEGLVEVRRQVNRVFTIIGRPLGDFKPPPEEDPDELLKHRFLCRRGGMLMTGPTGAGKSSFNMQALMLWSLGKPFCEIEPVKPINSVLIQAENDDGDIAEMRDGICTGLKLTEDQRLECFTRVVVHASTGITGQKFCSEVVRPLLDLHSPDLLCIDPALSFLGGDVKEQKDVGNFLRQYLNPELSSHDCACMVVHHTNKPKSGKDDNAPTNGEWAYQGSGSAEWANWARCVLNLQSSGEPGVYKLHAGKRGARIGWRSDNDEMLFDKIIVHAKEKGVICWLPGEESDLPNQGGRPAAYNPGEIISLLGDRGLETASWQKVCLNELGMSRSTFHRVKGELEKADLVLHERTSGKWVKVSKMQ